MKVIVLKEPGGVENLTLQEIQTPFFQDNEVLVKVKAISINPVDVKTRMGKGVYGRIKNEQPLILGWDISGAVVAVGDAVTKFKTGDTVFGMVNFPGHGKAYAEYIAAPETHLAVKPANSSHEESAAATLAALTAWQVLVHQVRIESGQRVFIHAAAGGVGHFAVQIAKHLGAYVTGTASPSNIAFLKELGVDEPVDYTASNFEITVQPTDFVLDPLGGENTKRSLNILKSGGTLVSIVGGVTEELSSIAKDRNIKASNYLVHSSGEDMEQLAQLLKGGKLKPHVSHTFPFEQIADAHRQVETGKTRGKVVVNIA